MRRPGFTAVLGLMGLLLVSGCINGGMTEIAADSRTGEKEVKISFVRLYTDKDTYRSAEVLNLSAVLLSDSDVENVSVMARGINGRMNLERRLNLTAGENVVSFTYRLPTCNVCGGIRAGTYSLDCMMTFENTTLENSTSVEIRQ